MPNGPDKNFVRLCAALDGFKGRHGHWPTRVVAYSMSLQNLRDHVLGARAFEAVIEKVELIEGEAGFRAEDEEGNVYEYAEDGFPAERPIPSAREWLGVEVKRHFGY